jgi:NAD(P)-dependent dehydrogenase (short-subunit alcohol dehydrogenase family)
VKHQKRVALVTGANKGIGFAISRRLAKKEITVVMGARDLQKGKAACAQLSEKGWDVHFHMLDVCRPDNIETILKVIDNHFKRLDILVNNAGIKIDGDATALTIDPNRLQETLQTNFFGPLQLCQGCIPLMRKHGYGRIVNMSSTLGSLAEIADESSAYSEIQSPAYRMSKAALNSITVLVAKEVRGENILVNSVCPGWVNTDLGGQMAPLTPDQGADTPAWLATLPDNGPSGGFFRERRTLSW